MLFSRGGGINYLDDYPLPVELLKSFYCLIYRVLFIISLIFYPLMRPYPANFFS